VSDGLSHLFDFQVDQLAVGESGSELALASPGTVKVRAQIAAYLEPAPSDQGRRIRRRPLSQKPYWHLERARIGDTRTVPVEVIVNGAVVRTLTYEADGEVRPLEVDLPIERSSWVAIRILPSSHTNPIFLTVGGKPIRASKASVEWCLKSVDQCWSQKEPQIRASEKAAAKQAFDRAREAYSKILAESEDAP
jgi:hypothetical protein